MLDNVVRAKGGLYNRLTYQIHLTPLSLSETRNYLSARGAHLNNLQILDLYLVLGGIPYYLRHIPKGKSPVQIINQLCFAKNAPLFAEFDLLFSSLFEHADQHIQLIRQIAKRRFGISRQQLLDATDMQSGGTFNKRLDELKSADSIETFVPFERAKKDYFIKVMDEFTLFYLYWIDSIRHHQPGSHRNYWQVKSKEQKFNIWKGHAFEATCLKHIDEIIYALDLSHVAEEVGSWRYLPSQGNSASGAQVDLLIDRSDQSITLCEIKYCNTLFTLDKVYAKNLINKINVFEACTKTKKQVFLSMISTLGIKRNVWAEDLVSGEVTLQDLLGVTKD